VFAWPTSAQKHKAVATTFESGTGSTGLVTVPVNGDGQVTVGASSRLHGLSVDILGYYTASGVGTNSLHSVSARRVVNSATGLAWQGKKLAVGKPASVRIAGRPGIPDNVRTVLVNVGLQNPSDNAAVSVSPPGTPASLGTVVRAPAHEVRTGTTVVRLVDGRLPLRLSAGRADVSVDVLGWFSHQDGTRSGRFRATTSTAVLAGKAGALGAGDSRKVQVRGGTTGVPGAASAVVVQALARGSSSPGSLSLTPAGSSATARPMVAYGRHGAVRNLVVVPVGADGSIRVKVLRASADVSLRVVGWYS